MVKLEKKEPFDTELTGVAIFFDLLSRSIPEAIHDTGCVPKKKWEIEKLKNFLTGR